MPDGDSSLRCEMREQGLGKVRGQGLLSAIASSHQASRQITPITIDGMLKRHGPLWLLVP
jgi:hypothetical protein